MAFPTTAPSGSLTDISTYISQMSAYLDASTQRFINDLAGARDLDYNTETGDPTVLKYLQWDYDELQVLIHARPALMVIDIAGTDADIDAVRQHVAPTEPTLNLPQVIIPSLDAERPLLTLPVLPGTDVGVAPSDEPSIDVLAIPDAPSFILPNVPSVEEMNLPTPPSFVAHSFMSSAPVNLLVAPTAEFAYVDAGYTSQLRDPITAKLLHDLENGSYGIEPSDELSLWGRARDRAEAQGRLAMEDAKKRAANMSFELPQGALFADMERARRDVSNMLSDINREIALKRADLYVEGRKFTYQQVQDLEKTSIALYNAIAERSFNTAKASVELGISKFDASVRNYNAQLDGYKTEAAVFESLIRAELVKAETFKAQIAAEHLRGEFNKIKVDLYQAQLNGIQTTVNLYKTRLEAVSTLAQVQQQKIEVFRARVQAYAERVRAKSAEYDMYRSAIQGETAKLEIYKTDIAAYESRLRGEELRVSAITKSNDVRVAQFREQLNRYKASIDATAKSADLRLEQQRAIVAASGVNVAGYRAMVDAITAGVQTRIDGQKMNNAWNIAAVNANVDMVKVRLETLKLSHQARIDIDKFGAKFYMDPLTATLASLNGLSVRTETASEA
jgi:hypothetical protein